MSKNQVIDYTNEVGKLTPIIKEQVELMKSFAESSKKAYASLPSDFQKQQREQLRLEQENEKLRQQSIRTQQQLEDLARRQITTARENQRLQAQNRREEEAQERTRQRAEAQQARANRQLEQENSAYLQLQKRWREAQRAYADLVVSQGRNSEATVRARQEFERLNTQLTTVDGLVRNYSRNVGNYASAFNGLGKLMGAFGVAGGLTMAVSVFKDASQIVREFDSQMINVQKTTGTTDEELVKLKDDVVLLSRELGVVSSAKLGEYMAVAGQLGIKGSKDLLSFTSAMAKLEVASTIAGEQGASEMARFLTLVDGGVKNVNKFGNEIVNLGNNFAATESEILGNATRIAQSTGIYNLGRQQVLAYATATKAVGVEAELVGSTMGRTLAVFEKSIRTGENLGTITKTLNTTQTELSQRFKTDASGVLQDYIKALNKTYESGGSVNAQLESIGINSIRDQSVLGSLASKGFGTLQDAMIKVTEAGNAMGNEFENASNKINSKVDKVKTSFGNLILDIDNGTGVVSTFFKEWLDGLAYTLDGLAQLSKSFNDVVKDISKQSQNIGSAQANIYLQGFENDEKVRERAKERLSELKKEELALIALENTAQKAYDKKQDDRIVPAWLGGNLIGMDTVEKNLKQATENLGKVQGQIKEINRLEKEYEANKDKNKTEDAVVGGGKELTKKQIKDAERAEEERQKAIYEAKKVSLTNEIESEKRISLITAKNNDDKLSAELQYNNRKIEILQLSYDEEVRLAKGVNEKIILAKNNFSSELQKIEDDTLKASTEANRKQFEYAIKLANMQSDNEVKNSMKSKLLTAKTEQQKLQIKINNIEKQKEILVRNEKQEIESGKHTISELKIIQEEYQQKRVELDQQASELISGNTKKLADDTKNYLSKFSDMGNFGFSSLNFFTDAQENGKTMFENLILDAENWKDAAAAAVGAVGEVFKDVMGAINQASKARFEAEIGRLKVEYETSLMFAGDSAEAKTKLEEEFNQKQKELKKKQAKQDKEMAIMNAIISTAQGVASMLATVPWPANLVMAGLVGALGAVQIATIASTPLPEFWTGTMDAPEGLALTQERGAEVITDKNNNVKTWGHNKGATLTYLNKGDKVYKSQEDYFKEQDEGFNNELNSILAGNNISPIIVNNGVTKEEIEEVMQSTLGKQPKYSTVVDEQGINTYWQTKDSRQKIKNRSARR